MVKMAKVVKTRVAMPAMAVIPAMPVMAAHSHLVLASRGHVGLPNLWKS